MKPFLPLLLLLLAAPAQAQEETLPFGLAALHWRTSLADALDAFPPLNQSHHLSDAYPWAARQLMPYAWKSCRLNLTFQFDEDGLARVTVDVLSGGAACNRDALADLATHYGAPYPGSKPWRRDWATFASKVSYVRSWGRRDFEIDIQRRPP